MHAMQWVMVLTFVLLYASAILFVSLVGHALIPGGGVPEEAQERFGTVVESMFLLFRVMSGDPGPIEPLFSTVPLRLLCVGFVVISNWSILAILTAVVSENIISATREHQTIEDQDAAIAFEEQRRLRLKTLFMKADKDGDGYLDQDEFYVLLNDKESYEEFHETTNLERADLVDLFKYLSQQGADGLWVINYEDFIEKLEIESKDVNERSVSRMEKQMRDLKQRIDRKLNSMQDGLIFQVGMISGRR